MPQHQHENLRRLIGSGGDSMPYRPHVQFQGSRAAVSDTGGTSVIDIAAPGGGGLVFTGRFGSYYQGSEDVANSTLNLGSMNASNDTPIDESTLSTGLITPLVTGLYHIEVALSFRGTELTDANRFALLTQIRRWPNGNDVQWNLFPAVEVLYHTAAGLGPAWVANCSLTTVLNRVGDDWDDVQVSLRRSLGTPDASKTISTYIAVSLIA